MTKPKIFSKKNEILTLIKVFFSINQLITRVFDFLQDHSYFRLQFEKKRKVLWVLLQNHHNNQILIFPNENKLALQWISNRVQIPEENLLWKHLHFIIPDEIERIRIVRIEILIRALLTHRTNFLFGAIK